MPVVASWLVGGGEMGTRMRAFDWSSTPLGALDSWPPSLRTVVSIVLGSADPMLAWWGPELTHFHNDACAAVIGRHHHDALGRSAPSIWAEAWPPLASRVDAVLREGRACVLEELPALPADGAHSDRLCGAMSCTPVRDEAGQPRGVLGACTGDRRLRARLRRMTEVRGVGVMLFDRDGVLVDANDEFLRMFAYTREDVTSRSLTWRVMTPPEYVALSESQLVGLAETGRIGPYQKEYLRRDGSRSWMLFSGVDLGDGTILEYCVDINDRKLAELALRESEQRQRQLAESLEMERRRLAAIVDNLPVGVWITDASGRAVGKNEAADRIWRGDAPMFDSTEDCLQYTAWDGLTGQELQAADYPLSEALASGASVGPRELRIRRFDGTQGTVLVSVVPFTDAHGQLQGTVGINVDITERAEIEAARRQNEARQAFLLRLSDALRTLPDPVDVQYEAARVLGEYLQADRVGYAEDGGDGESVIVTRNYTNGVPGIEGRYRYDDYGPELLRAFRAGRTVARPDIANDPTLTDEEKTAHAVLDLGATVNVPLVKGGRLVALMFVHFRRAHAWSPAELQLLEEVANRTWDAVERARAEQERRESEERFRVLADQAPIVVWVTNPAGGTDFVNGEYCRFFGVRPEEVRGDDWHRLVHPEDRGYLAAAAEAVRTRTTFQQEARVRRADGQWRWISAYSTPRWTADGHYLGTIGVLHDITDVKHAAAQLVDAARQKDAFIAVLAHELRNPLAPLRMSAALLQARAADDPTVRHCRDVIDRQVAQMARLLDDLLDVSRLSRGRLALQSATVSVRDVIERAVETVRPLFERSGHVLSVEMPVEPACVNGDSARLVQVFGNLLNNAVKFSEPGSHVRIQVEPCHDTVVLRVIDTGVGIAPDMVDRVFDLFEQAGSTADRAGGLGIGLALARQLVEMHGGTINCESAGPGQGSTFIVTLPRLMNRHEDLAVGAPLPTSLACRVLVVDDNQDAAEMTASLLALHGCTVKAVYSGEAALREAPVFRPDVFLLDLRMPGLDGIEVCRRLRSEDWGRRAKVFAVTGWGQDEDRRRSAQAGFDGHLVKPIDPATLLRVLCDERLEDGRPS